MKKLFSVISLMFISLALGTVSCDKDKTPEELLVGKWEVQSLTAVSYVNNVYDDEETEQYDPGEMQLEFKGDKTGNEYSNGTPGDQFTWSVNGNKLTINYSGGNPLETEYTVNETTLTFSVTLEFDNVPEAGDHTKIIMTFTATRI